MLTGPPAPYSLVLIQQAACQLHAASHQDVTSCGCEPQLRRQLLCSTIRVPLGPTAAGTVSSAGLPKQAAYICCPAWLHMPAANAAIWRRACPLQPFQDYDFRHNRCRLNAAPWSATRGLFPAGRLLVQHTSILPCSEGLGRGSCDFPNPLLHARRFCCVLC